MALKALHIASSCPSQKQSGLRTLEAQQKLLPNVGFRFPRLGSLHYSQHPTSNTVRRHSQVRVLIPGTGVEARPDTSMRRTWPLRLYPQVFRAESHSAVRFYQPDSLNMVLHET
jgi:hypothetical protein